MKTTIKIFPILFIYLLFAACEKENEITAQVNEIKIFEFNTSFSFYNESIGFVSGNDDPGSPQIAKTTNGGITWEKTPVEIEGIIPVSIRNIYAYNTDIIYMIYSLNDDTSGVAVSHDGGVLWKNIDSLPFSRYNSIYFKDQQTAFIAHNEGILRTDDGGSTWNVVYNEKPTAGLYEFIFTNDVIGYSYNLAGDTWGAKSTLLTTMDGGLTWQDLDSPGQHTSLGFTEDTTGYLFAWEGGIYKTSDGGSTWELKKQFEEQIYFASVVDDKIKFFTVNQDIYYTEDDFKNIHKIYTLTKSLKGNDRLKGSGIRLSENEIVFLSPNTLIKISY